MFQHIGIKRPISIGILCVFLANFLVLPQANAVETPFMASLPKPGQMVGLSPAFSPVVLKGIKLDPKDPMKFNFLVDPGDDVSLRGAQATKQSNKKIASPTARNDARLKSEANKLIKYFLASLTIPEEDLWVNLSPYEKNRIVPQEFGQTQMGRDLLAQDYLLKQITASLIYPEGETGRKFWKEVYAQAQAKYGTTNIPVNTFNKVWIVPEKAVVYENAGTAFVLENHLKVMLEEDYLSAQKHAVETRFIASPKKDAINGVSTEIIRTIVIPKLEQEVNHGANFAQLRQVFYSLILATWYKKKIKDSILNKVYSNRKKIQSLSFPSASVGNPEQIYQQYLAAFKKGVFNYIKEEPDPLSNQATPRKYFSGGVNAQKLAVNLETRDRSQVSLKDFPQMDSMMQVEGDYSLIRANDKAVLSNITLEPSEKILESQKKYLSDVLIFLNKLGVRKGSRIVSVGTGYDWLVGIAAASLGAHYIGFDLHENYNRHINDQFQKQLTEGNGKAEQRTGEFSYKSSFSKDIPEGSQDFVLMLKGVLSDPFPESDAADVLKEALRVVSNNGKLVVGTIGNAVEKSSSATISEPAKLKETLNAVFKLPEWNNKYALTPESSNSAKFWEFPFYVGKRGTGGGYFGVMDIFNVENRGQRPNNPASAANPQGAKGLDGAMFADDVMIPWDVKRIVRRLGLVAGESIIDIEARQSADRGWSFEKNITNVIFEGVSPDGAIYYNYIDGWVPFHSLLASSIISIRLSNTNKIRRIIDELRLIPGRSKIDIQVTPGVVANRWLSSEWIKGVYFEGIKPDGRIYYNVHAGWITPHSLSLTSVVSIKSATNLRSSERLDGAMDVEDLAKFEPNTWEFLDMPTREHDKLFGAPSSWQAAMKNGWGKLIASSNAIYSRLGFKQFSDNLDFSNAEGQELYNEFMEALEETARGASKFVDKNTAREWSRRILEYVPYMSSNANTWADTPDGAVWVQGDSDDTAAAINMEEYLRRADAISEFTQRFLAAYEKSWIAFNEVALKYGLPPGKLKPLVPAKSLASYLPPESGGQYPINPKSATNLRSSEGLPTIENIRNSLGMRNYKARYGAKEADLVKDFLDEPGVADQLSKRLETLPQDFLTNPKHAHELYQFVDRLPNDTLREIYLFPTKGFISLHQDLKGFISRYRTGKDLLSIESIEQDQRSETMASVLQSTEKVIDLILVIYLMSQKDDIFILADVDQDSPLLNRWFGQESRWDRWSSMLSRKSIQASPNELRNSPSVFYNNFLTYSDFLIERLVSHDRPTKANLVRAMRMNQKLKNSVKYFLKLAGEMKERYEHWRNEQQAELGDLLPYPIQIEPQYPNNLRILQEALDEAMTANELWVKYQKEFSDLKGININSRILFSSDDSSKMFKQVILLINFYREQIENNGSIDKKYFDESKKLFMWMHGLNSGQWEKLINHLSQILYGKVMSEDIFKKEFESMDDLRRAMILNFLRPGNVISTQAKANQEIKNILLRMFRIGSPKEQGFISQLAAGQNPGLDDVSTIELIVALRILRSAINDGASNPRMLPVGTNLRSSERLDGAMSSEMGWDGIVRELYEEKPGIKTGLGQSLPRLPLSTKPNDKVWVKSTASVFDQIRDVLNKDYKIGLDKLSEAVLADVEAIIKSKESNTQKQKKLAALLRLSLSGKQLAALKQRLEEIVYWFLVIFDRKRSLMEDYWKKSAVIPAVEFDVIGGEEIYYWQNNSQGQKVKCIFDPEKLRQMSVSEVERVWAKAFEIEWSEDMAIQKTDPAVFSGGYNDEQFRKMVSIRRGLPGVLQITPGDIQGKKFLELAAGDGLMSYVMAEMGAEVTTLDANLNWIKLAKRLARNLSVAEGRGDLSEKIDYKIDRLGSLTSVADNSFDIIYMGYVLQYFPDSFKKIVFNNISKKLKKGGRLIFAEGVPQFLPKLEGEFDSHNYTKMMQILFGIDHILMLQKNSSTDQYMSTAAQGGINLNPAQMNLQVQGKKEDFSFEINGETFDTAQIAGLSFTIRSITPVSDLPTVLGLVKA